MGIPHHPEYNPSDIYTRTDYIADQITSPSKLSQSRLLDWNKDGLVDNMEAVGSGLGVVAGTLLAKKGIEALKNRHDRKMMEKYNPQQFSEKDFAIIYGGTVRSGTVHSGTQRSGTVTSGKTIEPKMHSGTVISGKTIEPEVHQGTQITPRYVSREELANPVDLVKETPVNIPIVDSSKSIISNDRPIIDTTKSIIDSSKSIVSENPFISKENPFVSGDSPVINPYVSAVRPAVTSSTAETNVGPQVDTDDSILPELGIGAGLALGTLGMYKYLKHRKKKRNKGFSEDKKGTIGQKIDSAKDKLRPSKENAPIYAVGAALGVGAYQLAKKAMNSETGQKVKNALFSEDEKEHPIVRGARTGARVGGLGIASTLVGHALGGHNQMVKDTSSKIEDIFLANPTYSMTQNSDGTVTARFIPTGSILPKSADGSSATNATMNLYKEAYGKEMVDTNSVNMLDVTGNGSLKDELGIGAAVLLGSSLLGSAIAQHKDKKKKKGFSEKSDKVPGWVTAAGLGSGATALGGAYVLDKTGASEKVWNAAKNAYEYITNPEIYEKIKGVVDISGDGSMIDELGSAGVTLGLGTLLARQLYKHNKKRGL